MARHCYTPSSARSALATLRPAAEKVCRLVRALEGARPARIRCDQRVDPAYFRLLTRLYETLGVFRRRGVRVHDLKRCRLGFPARRDGRRVMLCWEVGEPTLSHWRDPAAREAARLPVDEDGPWEDG